GFEPERRATDDDEPRSRTIARHVPSGGDEDVLPLPALKPPEGTDHHLVLRRAQLRTRRAGIVGGHRALRCPVIEESNVDAWPNPSQRSLGRLGNGHHEIAGAVE